MEKFHLPDEYLEANWGLKYKLVKEFITKFKDKKKDNLNFKKRISWNTPLLLELLDILNLVPADKNFKYKNWQASFNVKCIIIIHNHSINVNDNMYNFVPLTKSTHPNFY
ncbi:hypothetical protein ABDH65_13420 [Heyndrickxia ginsengihumi]|uniref:hypothetical protein n=1 Tax=Heyndrickxia ginsengihumi TaxID=363870 RepID=UPI003D25F83B